jgi:hypothetical protein
MQALTNKVVLVTGRKSKDILEELQRDIGAMILGRRSFGNHNLIRDETLIYASAFSCSRRILTRSKSGWA